jgi:hypothetical protein
MPMCLCLFGLSKRCWLYSYCIRHPTLRRQRFKDSRIRSIRNGYRRMCRSQSIIASPFAKYYVPNVTAANTYTVSFKFLQFGPLQRIFFNQLGATCRGRNAARSPERGGRRDVCPRWSDVLLAFKSVRCAY